jgi:mRNA interferase MazF
MKNAMHRGDIFWADLDPVKGSEQGKTRPVLIIQSDKANEKSPVTIVA